MFTCCREERETITRERPITYEMIFYQLFEDKIYDTVGDIDLNSLINELLFYTKEKAILYSSLKAIIVRFFEEPTQILQWLLLPFFCFVDTDHKKQAYYNFRKFNIKILILDQSKSFNIRNVKEIKENPELSFEEMGPVKMKTIYLIYFFLIFSKSDVQIKTEILFKLLDHENNNYIANSNKSIYKAFKKLMTIQLFFSDIACNNFIYKMSEQEYKENFEFANSFDENIGLYKKFLFYVKESKGIMSDFVIYITQSLIFFERLSSQRVDKRQFIKILQQKHYEIFYPSMTRRYLKKHLESNHIKTNLFLREFTKLINFYEKRSKSMDDVGVSKFSLLNELDIKDEYFKYEKNIKENPIFDLALEKDLYKLKLVEDMLRPNNHSSSAKLKRKDSRLNKFSSSRTIFSTESLDTNISSTYSSRTVVSEIDIPGDKVLPPHRTKCSKELPLGRLLNPIRKNLSYNQITSGLGLSNSSRSFKRLYRMPESCKNIENVIEEEKSFDVDLNDSLKFEGKSLKEKYTARWTPKSDKKDDEILKEKVGQSDSEDSLADLDDPETIQEQEEQFEMPSRNSTFRRFPRLSFIKDELAYQGNENIDPNRETITSMNETTHAPKDKRISINGYKKDKDMSFKEEDHEEEIVNVYKLKDRSKSLMNLSFLNLDLKFTGNQSPISHKTESSHARRSLIGDIQSSHLVVDSSVSLDDEENTNNDLKNIQTSSCHIKAENSKSLVVPINSNCQKICIEKYFLNFEGPKKCTTDYLDTLDENLIRCKEIDDNDFKPFFRCFNKSEVTTILDGTIEKSVVNLYILILEKYNQFLFNQCMVKSQTKFLDTKFYNCLRRLTKTSDLEELLKIYQNIFFEDNKFIYTNESSFNKLVCPIFHETLENSRIIFLIVLNFTEKSITFYDCSSTLIQDTVLFVNLKNCFLSLTAYFSEKYYHHSDAVWQLNIDQEWNLDTINLCVQGLTENIPIMMNIALQVCNEKIGQFKDNKVDINYKSRMFQQIAEFYSGSE